MKRILLLSAAALMFSISQAKAVNSTETMINATQTQQGDEVRMVVNDDFLKYFEENRLRMDDQGNNLEGKVVAEFRVNDHGVPSSIQIVSGFSREANRDLIDLLVKGPKWEPTNGERIRIEVEYK